MRKYLLIAVALVLSYLGHASTIYSSQNGNWNNTSTWLGGVIPGPGDDVVILGETIQIDDSDGAVTVASITLANTLTSNPSRLEISGSVEVTMNWLYAYTGTNFQDVELTITGDATLTVNGNVTFQRTELDNTSGKLQLYIGAAAVMRVSGNFDFKYEDSGTGENNAEVVLTDTAKLEVAQNLYLEIKDGNDLTFNVQKSAELTVGDSLQLEKTGGGSILVYIDSITKFSVSGAAVLNNSGGTGNLSISGNQQTDGLIHVTEDLLLSNTNVDLIVNVELNENTTLDVDGDIVLTAESEGDVYISMNNQARLNLAGSLTRPRNFGSVFMGSDARLVYDGSGPQTIACSNMPGSGTDNFVCSNVDFDNTSGTPIALEGDWVIRQELNLSRGIIQTADTALLIVSDGATIVGGNSAAYVEGPMKKIGTSKASTFLFPLGHNSVYAPLEIEAVTNTGYEYQAQYFSCPPPIEDGLEPPLSNISGQGFWTLAKSAGAPDVEVGLHWSDADAAGIGDLDSLLVAGLTDNGDGTTTWVSYGNNRTTGGVGTGVSGSLFSDPPPLDEVGTLTLGSANIGSNALPVILLDFTATPQGSGVLVNWTTIMEEDADFFSIERSVNGRSFVSIGESVAMGTANGPQSYRFMDVEPLPGVNYYRLKQVDLNGQFMYSPIVTAFTSVSNATLSATPTLVRETLTLSGFDEREEQLIIEIYHQSGKLIYRGEIEVVDGVFHLPTAEVGMDYLGMYHIVVRDGPQIQTVKVIKLE